MTYPDALNALHSAGFTNITSNVDSNTDESLWVVVRQSISAGEKIRAGDEIEPICRLKCKLYIDLHSESNWILSTYDIAVTLDGTELGSIPNGKSFTYLADVLSGEHTLMFCKSGSTSPSCVKIITVSSDMTYYCDLGHSGSSIEIKNERIESSISGSALEVIDVTGMVLSDAMAKLVETGFTNLREEPYGSIWDKNNWIVSAQSVAAGTITDKNTFIQLDCIKRDAYSDSSHGAGTSSNSSTEKKYDLDKDLTVVQCEKDAEKESMYHITFAECDNNGNPIKSYTFKSIINPRAMGAKFNAIGDLPTWFYVGSVVHVKAKLIGGNISTADCTVTEATGISDNSSSKTTAEIKPMPVMTGTSLDTVLDAAKTLGLSRVYSDEDFGHGTMMCPLANGNSGLRLDIIYSADTNEVLCGSITTLHSYSSVDEQKAFIKAMAGVLCPNSDKATVTNWVNSNIGNSAETTINGFVYEVGLGPAGNNLYFAGERNWEEVTVKSDRE